MEGSKRFFFEKKNQKTFELNENLAKPRHARAGGHPRLYSQEDAGKKAILIVLAICSFAALASPGNAATIPFVGCLASGQQNIPAPFGKPIQLDIPQDIASKLAVYAGAFQVILAPRGWKCSGGAGSDAISLSIVPAVGSPDANDASIVIRADMQGTGTARFDLMTIGRTYFPNLVGAAQYETFLHEWKQQGETAIQAPRYPTDRIKYLSQSAFEYETPAGKNGVAQLSTGGNSPFAQYGIISVQGEYFPGVNEDDRVMFFLNVDLPPDLADLTPYILAASKPCMLDRKSAACSIYDDIVHESQ
jgi:hypothetical protein